MDTDCSSEIESSDCSETESDSDSGEVQIIEPPKDYNVLHKIYNRQLYGRFTKNSKAKTDKVFTKVPDRLHFNFNEVIPITTDAIAEIYMGFSQCGRFLLSYTTDQCVNIDRFSLSCRYILHIWTFVPGRQIKLAAEHRIFKHFKNTEDHISLLICQWPTDSEKIVIYGLCQNFQSEAYLTIVTLPSTQKCKDCTVKPTMKDSPIPTSQCLKHGVTVDLMFSIVPPLQFRPSISLAYPGHVILNTGHYLYAFKLDLTSTYNESLHSIPIGSLITTSEIASTGTYPDNMSDISESVSLKQEYNFEQSDVSDCETENSEYSKPFHELNISCEPLNVTARSYCTPEPIQTTSKPLKMFVKASPGPSSNLEKSKAEKAYEFIEETEKCEKLSLFRKKRLADKKYEFSEDNSENIVPFNLLRHERRFFKGCTSKTRSSTETFLSPRNSPRSPILSPNNSRITFSPSDSRNNTTVYNRFISPSPTNHTRSPISPLGRESTKKYDIYSPSHIDSDDDSKLVLRKINKVSYSPKVTEMTSDSFIRREPLLLDRIGGFQGGSATEGLLVVNERMKVVGSKETGLFVRELVRRYSAGDFESASSLASDGQRDDFVAVEVPILVHTSTSGEEQRLDIVPSHFDNIIDPGLVLIHRTFDAEQFCHYTAKRICTERGLKFTHCADYDINIINVCPLSGDAICSAYIEVGSIPKSEPTSLPRMYQINFVFIWGAGRPGGNYCVINTDVQVEPRHGYEPFQKKLDENLLRLLSSNIIYDIRVLVNDPECSVTKLTDQYNSVSITLDQEDSEDDRFDYFFH